MSIKLYHFIVRSFIQLGEAMMVSFDASIEKISGYTGLQYLIASLNG